MAGGQNNTLGNIGKGAALGANPALLAATGGLSLPIGAALGGLTSLVEGIHAKKDRNAADNLQPSLYDPQQQAFLAEINQKRKSINSGSAFAADMGDINQSQQGTDQAIVQNGGGDAGGTIAGLLAAQTNAGRLKNQVFGQANAEGQFYNTFGSNLTDAIAGRSLQLQLAQQAQKRAQWAQNSQDAFGNAAATAAHAGTGGGSGINWADLFHRHGAPDLSGVGGDGTDPLQSSGNDFSKTLNSGSQPGFNSILGGAGGGDELGDSLGSLGSL